MLSKNNFKERLRKMEPRKERFSIRKFSVGVASVLIGFFFMDMGAGQEVQAADNPATKLNESGQVVKTTGDKEKATKDINTESLEARSTDTIVAKSVKLNQTNNTTSTKNENKAKVVKSVDQNTNSVDTNSNTEHINNSTQSTDKQDTTKENIPASTISGQNQAKSVDKKATANTVQSKLGTKKNEETKNVTDVKIPETSHNTSLDAFAKQAKDLEAKIPKMSEAERNDALAQLKTAKSKLSSADLAKLATMSTTSQEQPVKAFDLQSFTGALANKAVHEITLTNNIDFSNYKDQTNLATGGLRKPGEMAFNDGKLIESNNKYYKTAHDVVIDGQGHTLNMGDTFISFWNNNYNQGDKGWDITFKNLTINQTNKSYSPFYFGNASADNQKKSSLTFENVTANVTRTLNTYDGDNVAIHFKGDNNVTVANMTQGVNAVNGLTVDFTKSSDPKSTNTTTFTINGDIKGSGNSGNWANAAIYASSTGKKAVNIANGTTVNINSKSADLRGITAGDIGIVGDQGAELYVAGNLNENLANGHSTAIWVGNLTINGGKVNIQTKQDNEADGTENGWVNGVTNYNGYHFAPISLGVGSKGALQDSDAALTINNSGELHVTRGNVTTLTPLISYGTGGAHNNSKFGLTVGQDGTDVVLDLQDGASTPSNFHGYPWNKTGAYLGAKNSIFWPGMIHMFGAGCTANLNFGDVKYVNLQRTGGQRGFLIALEGKNNQASINASGIPLAQWMQNNTTAKPDHAWLIDGLTSQNEMGNYDANFVPVNSQPSISPSSEELNMLFGQSNGQATMAPIMAGKNSASYNNGSVYGPANAQQGIQSQHSNYLQNLMDNFNWWTPRRISFGHQLDNNPDIIKTADAYQPKVQTINTTTKKNLKDLKVKDGIEGFYDKSLNVIPANKFNKVDWANSQFGVNWSETPWANASWMVKPGTKLTEDEINAAVKKVVNSDADQQAFDRMNLKNEIDAYNTFVDNIMKAKISDNGNLAKADAYTSDGKLNNAETATIVYTDGSADFVNIPINVTDQLDNEIYQPAYDPMNVEQGKSDSENPSYKEETTKDTNGKTITINPDGKAPKGTEYAIPSTADTPFATVNSATGALTIAPTADNSKIGLITVPVIVTYPDKSTDTVKVPVYIGDATHTGKITTDSNDPSKVTGAYEVVTRAPADLKAHETTENSMNLKPGDAVQAINHYTISENGKITKTAVDPKDATIAWKGETPSTVVPTATASENINGTVSVTIDGTTVDSNEMTIPTLGATSKNLDAPIKVIKGSDLTKEQFSNLVNTKIPADEIASTTWASAPEKGRDATIKITFTDKDTNGQPTYLNVTVPAKDLDITTYANEYKPSYKVIGVKAGEITTDHVQYENKKTAPAGTKYTKGENVPAWATVNPTTGTITLKPGTDVTAGVYKIPVTVSFPDKTSTSTTAIVNVIGIKHKNDGTSIYYGNDYNFSVSTGEPSYHKTTNGSENVGNGSAVGLTEIDYNNEDAQTGMNIDPIVYKLSTDGKSFVAQDLVTGIILRTTYEQAPESFSAAGVHTIWQDGYKPNTNVSNFPVTGTKTMTAAQGINKANGFTNKNDDQRVNTPGVALNGNSKFRVNINFDGDVASILGTTTSGWCNVFANFYGAEANGTIPSVNSNTKTLEKDLGDAGNYVDHSALTPKHNSTVKNYTWSRFPDLTKADAKAPATVQINFEDGTHLDIPVSVNVIKVVDGIDNKTNHDLYRDITRTINVEGQKDPVVQHVIYSRSKVTNLAKPANQQISYTDWKAAVNKEGAPVTTFPQLEVTKSGYTAKATGATIETKDGKQYVPASATIGPDASNETVDVTYTANEHTLVIHYADKSGKVIGNPYNVTGKTGENVNIDVAGHVPTNWTLVPGQSLLKNYKFGSNDPSAITYTIEHKTETISVDKNNKDTYREVVQTINETIPGQDIKTVRIISVPFQRTGTKDLVTGNITWNEWQGPKGTVDGKYTIPEYSFKGIEGYDTYINEKKVAENIIPAEIVNVDSKNSTYNITFVKQNSTPVPYDPANKDMNMSVSRKIEYDVDGTGHSAIKSEIQTINYVRDHNGVAGYKDPVTGQITWNSWTVKGNGATEFPAYDVIQIKGFDSYVDGIKSAKVASATVIEKNGTPQNAPTITVTYKKVAPTAENFAQSIVYKDAEGKEIKTVENAIKGTFTSEKSATVSAEEERNAINENVPTNWKIATNYKYPVAETVSTKNPVAIEVLVEHATKDITPTSPDVDPTNPKYKDMFTTVSRDIYQTKPGETEKKIDTQSVSFGRNGIEDLVTGEIKGTGDWEVGKIESKKFVPGGSAEFVSMEAPQIADYDSYVDGTKSTEVPSAPALKNDQPVNGDSVYITYFKKGATVTPIPYDPTDQNMNKDVIRTIIIHKTDGTTATETQTVHFVRGGDGQDAGEKDPAGNVSWTAWTVATKTSDTWKSTGEKNGTWAEYKVTQVNGYKSTVDGKDATKVDSEIVNAETSNATVSVAYIKTINPTDVDPTNPAYKDMFKNVTRTITVNKPGIKAEKEIQVVNFGRSMTTSTDPDVKPTYGEWKVGKIEGNKFIENSSIKAEWPEFSAPTVEGYVPSPTTVEAETVTPETQDADVTITYSQKETDADKYEPEPQPITTPEGEVPDPAQGIKNKDQMPSGTKYTWTDPDKVGQDIKTPGSHDETITVTYPDGSKDTVTVPVNVTKKETDANKYEPEPQPITTPEGEMPDPAQGIKNKDQMPSGTKYTWTDPDKVGQDVKTPGSHDETITVTYPDGSKDTVTVPVNVTKKETDADKYEPEPQPITTPEGEVPDPAQGIKNKDEMPSGTTITWTDPNKVGQDVKTPGSHDETITVTYPDGSKDTVTVPVSVTTPQPEPVIPTPSTPTDADQYEPEPQPINTQQGQIPDPSQGIKNKDQLPAGTTITWTDSNKVAQDIQTPGIHDESITVTYPDGSKDVVTVPVNVTKKETDADKYKPETQPIDTPQGEVPDPTQGIKNKDELPEGTKIDWQDPDKVKDDVKTSGTHEATIVVTYPDGSKDTVTVTINVEPKDEDGQTTEDHNKKATKPTKNAKWSTNNSAHAEDLNGRHHKNNWSSSTGIHAETGNWSKNTGVHATTTNGGTHRKGYNLTTGVHGQANNNATTSNIKKRKTLPQTGENQNRERVMAMIGFALAGVGTLLGLGKDKKRKKR